MQRAARSPPRMAVVKDFILKVKDQFLSGERLNRRVQPAALQPYPPNTGATIARSLARSRSVLPTGKAASLKRQCLSVALAVATKC